MEENIKYYIGNKVYRGGTPDEILTGVESSGNKIILSYADGDQHTFDKGKVPHKLILLPLDSLTPNDFFAIMADIMQVNKDNEYLICSSEIIDHGYGKVLWACTKSGASPNDMNTELDIIADAAADEYDNVISYDPKNQVLAYGIYERYFTSIILQNKFLHGLRSKGYDCDGMILNKTAVIKQDCSFKK